MIGRNYEGSNFSRWIRNARISEYTDLIPKPMIKIGGEPIITHIMSIYHKFGFNEFVIALGYKSQVIKDYFLNFRSLNSDLLLILKMVLLNFFDKQN